VLRVSILFACGVLGLLSETPVPAAKHFRLVPLGSGVYAAVAKPGDRDSVGNAGFVVGEEAVLVVDAFATPAAAEELLAQIRATTKLPVRWLVDTHYHLDHVGGNGVFARAGAVIIAHENVRAWERTENLKWRGEIGPAEKEMLSRLVLPDLTYREGLTVWLGTRRVDVLVRPGHTGGDSLVGVPDADVLFAGDLFWNATVPNLVDADTAAWQKTLEGLLDAFPRAAFVPGHGEVGHALDVRFFRDYVFSLRRTVTRGIEEGKSGKSLVDALLPLYSARYGAWTWFDQFAAKNIETTEREIRGTKRYAPTPAAEGAGPK
jgi:cyclase